MNTLFDYYSSKGKSLPSLAERANSYEDLGLGSAASYRGTAEQNNALLANLKNNGSPLPKTQKAQPKLLVTDQKKWNILWDKIKRIFSRNPVSASLECPDCEESLTFALPKEKSPDDTQATGVDIKLFTEWKGSTEGVVDHTGSEGQPTYAYGILPATAKAYNIDRNIHGSGFEFAAAVYTEMLKTFNRNYPSARISDMPRDIAHAVLSLYINIGQQYPSTTEALSRRDYLEAFHSSLDIVNYTHKESKATYFSKGLAVRRATEWNKVASSIDQPTITEIRLTGTRENPTAEYITEDGSVIHRHHSKHPLSPENNMKPSLLNM